MSSENCRCLSTGAQPFDRIVMAMSQQPLSDLMSLCFITSFERKCHKSVRFA